MHLSHDRATTITAAIASIGSDKHVLKLGATNIRAASRRTLSFDIPAHPLVTSTAEPTPTVSRIKVVAHGDGTVTVRLIEAHKAEGLVPLDTDHATTHSESEPMQPDALGGYLKEQIGFGK